MDPCLWLHCLSLHHLSVTIKFEKNCGLTEIAVFEFCHFTKKAWKLEHYASSWSLHLRNTSLIPKAYEKFPSLTFPDRHEDQVFTPKRPYTKNTFLGRICKVLGEDRYLGSPRYVRFSAATIQSIGLFLISHGISQWRVMSPRVFH